MPRRYRNPYLALVLQYCPPGLWSARDYEILRARNVGVTLKTLGALHGITGPRVRQIEMAGERRGMRRCLGIPNCKTQYRALRDAEYEARQ